MRMNPLRPHRYKPLLVTREERAAFRDEFFARLEPVARAWRVGEVGDIELVATYWFEFMRLWRPRHWRSGKWVHRVSRAVTPELAPLKWRFRSCPEAAQRAFEIWVENPTWIRVREDIPSCRELLAEQCEGRRVITLITDRELFLEEFNGRDPLSFLLHDLVHAYQFFADPELKSRQIDFYRELRWQLDTDAALKDRVARDASFAEQFEYLIADMNSHPAHLRAYYHHILTAATAATT